MTMGGRVCEHLFKQGKVTKESISHLFCTLKNGILWLVVSTPTPETPYDIYDTNHVVETSYPWSFFWFPLQHGNHDWYQQGGQPEGKCPISPKTPGENNPGLELTASLPLINGGWKVSSLWGLRPIFRCDVVSFRRIKFLQMPHGANSSMIQKHEICF